MVTNYLNDAGLTFTIVRPHLVAIQIEESLIPKTLFGLGERKIWITDIEIKKPDLEDVFMAIAKGGVHALAKS